MRIKTQLTLIMLFFSIAVLAISASVIQTHEHSGKLNKQEELARKIEFEASELFYLSNYSIPFSQDGQGQDLWQRKFSSLSNRLTNLKIDQADQQAVLSRMMANQSILARTFNDLKGMNNSSQNADWEQIRALDSQIAFRSQGIVSDSILLSQMIREQAEQRKGKNFLLITVLMGILSILLLTNYVFFYRGMMRSITNLQAGTELISQGNLDLSLEENRNDEIGDLSRSFNTMARKLKGITISKADLEKEIAVRKNVEETLRLSEERYRSLFSGMTEGFALHQIILDEDGKPCDYLFLDINPAFEKLTGLDRADVIGRTHSEILPDSSANLVEVYGRVALSGEPVRFENYSPELKKYYEVFAYRPAPQQFVTVFVDITERKHQEDKIAKLTRLYEVLSRVNGATVRIRDLGLLYREVCRIVAEIGGFPLVWIGEVRDSELVFASCSGTASDYLKGVRLNLQGEESFEPTATSIREGRAVVIKDLRTSPASPSGNRSPDYGLVASAAFPLHCHGKVAGAITLYSVDPNRFDGEEICLLESLSQDLSHALDAIYEERLRIQAESELRETRDYLESLIDNANAPIIVWDPDYRIIRFNHAFERMTGLLASDVLGRKLDILFPEESRMVAFNHIKRALSGERWETVEIPIWNTGGSVRTALWNSANILDKEGSKVVATIAQGQDITERKLIEMELLRARDDLEERVRDRTADLCRISQQLACRAEELDRKTEELMRSNAELEQFAHIASHDLQEPLRMISSYVQLLSRRYRDRLDDDAIEFIDYAVEGTRRMQQLIDDLLAYSRVGTRARPLSPTSLEQALSEALANLKLAVEESGAVVTHDELPLVTADKVQMVQLFQNLISNAIKFKSNEVPRVHICARKNEREWTISVQDNGIGIDPQFFDRIFTIFQKLHGRDEYPGTGIGLTIAKKIVERHGGRIWLQSRPGSGSTFYFTIPLENQSRDRETEIEGD